METPARPRLYGARSSVGVRPRLTRNKATPPKPASLPELSRHVERRRPRRPLASTSKGGVRETAVALKLRALINKIEAGALPSPPPAALEVKPNLRRHRSRRHIMRAAEGGKKVIERAFVGNVDGSHLRTPLVLVARGKGVMPRARSTGGGAQCGRVVVIARRTWRGYREQSRSISRRIFADGERRGKRGALVPTEQSSLQAVDRRRTVKSTGPPSKPERSRHQTAVISPVEADPRPACPGLILQVSCLVELLIVIDGGRGLHSDPPSLQPPICGGKKRAATLEKTMSAVETVNIRDAHAARDPGILGVVPGNREEDRCVPRMLKS